MHPANFEDLPTLSDRLAVIGLPLFVLLVIATCIYLIWKLPRGGDGPDDGT